MKIAMIDPSLFTLPYDGALCSALLAKGCDVTLYGRRPRSLERVPPEVALRPFFYRISETVRPRAPELLFHLVKGTEHAADMGRLVRTFRRERPAVVHFQWAPLPAIDVGAVRRIRKSVGPVVLTVHDIMPFNGGPTSAIQRIGSTSIWGEFDHLIVHTESSRTLLAERGLPIDRISTIAHGILDVITARRQPAGEGAPLVFLMFGKVKIHKGVDVMIEALARVPADLRARCQVLVVGEPMIPMEPLMKRAEELGVAGNMKWDLRFVSGAEMGEVFSQADVFAFPYRDIDTSGVLMSCLPYGKPVIASGIGAFQNLLRDGTHGRIVPPNDPEALAAAIEALLANPAMLPAYGRNVAMLGTQIPSWDAIAEQTIGLYERLVAAREHASRPAAVRTKTSPQSGKAADFVR